MVLGGEPGGPLGEAMKGADAGRGVGTGREAGGSALTIRMVAGVFSRPKPCPGVMVQSPGRLEIQTAHA